MSNTENIKTVTMTGSGDEVVLVNKNLFRTQITVNGLAAGSLTIKAKANGSTSFEDVQNGTIDLTTVRTLIIEGDSLGAIQATTTESSNYDLVIVQTAREIYS